MIFESASQMSGYITLYILPEAASRIVMSTCIPLVPGTVWPVRTIV